jgi:hypothetical protein
MRADRAAASAGQSGLMALYDTLFAMMDLQASPPNYHHSSLDTVEGL